MNIFEIPINVRFLDIDVMGHVNHTVIIGYFTEGRNRFLEGFYSHFDQSGFPFIMASVACRYCHPIDLDNTPSVQVTVKEIKDKSFTLGYKLIEIQDKSLVYAEGESVQVCYNYKLKRSTEIHEKLRIYLQKYAVDK